MRQKPRLGPIAAALFLLFVTAPVPANSSDDVERPSFSGTWELNEELSEDPREKMREAMSSQRGGSRGGGRGGGGFGGGGGRGGGFGSGGGRGVGSGSGGRGASGDQEAMQEQMRAYQEGFALLEIIHGEPELMVRYGDDREETLYTDGRAFDRTMARGELVEATAKWKGKERIVVKADGGQSKITETWEWVPDAGQLWVTTKMEGDGRRPTIEFRRVYDPVEVEEIGEESMGGEPEIAATS